MTQYTVYSTPRDTVGETWAPLTAYLCPQYEISTKGRVRHERNRNIRAVSVNQYGTLFHTLQEDSYNGRRRTVPLAKAVALTFIGEPDEHIPSPTVIHKDGDKSNCELDNLCWRSRSYARRYERDWDSTANPSGLAVKAVGANNRLLGRYESEGALAQAYGVLVGDVVRAEALHTELPFNPGIYVTYDSVR